MKRQAILLVVLPGWLFVTTGSLQARPAHKQALAQYFGAFLPKKVNDCRTCHLPDSADQAKVEEDYEKPHNAFGARLKSVRDELRKAGKASTLDARLDAILKEDADGDGVANLEEILTGHNPGDAKDRPKTADLEDGKNIVAAFLKMKRGWPWRPFERVERPPLPKLKNPTWARNPIDIFVAAEHEELGLKPRPEAPGHVLLRRVYLDLIGLPPTPAELEAFLQDQSPDAFAKVVDRLLTSPQYGERWGRHWMDVWRYSDWAGYGAQVRDSQPHIWRWRDWIIESLTTDKPYDRMILEMLAGDELAPEDPKALAATGYLVRNFKLLSREKWLQDTVDHTAQAFLGITLQCAKCHDHMYDPILQKEYYRMRAIFEPHHVRTESVPGQPDIKKDGLPRVFDKDLTAPTYFFIRGDDRTPDKSKPLEPGVPEILGGRFQVEPVKLPTTAICPEMRDFVIEDTIKAGKEAIAKAQAAAQSLKASDPQERIVMAQFEVDLATAKQEALLAVLKAEKLEDAGKTSSEEWKQAALQANQAQRKVKVIEARQILLRSQHPKVFPPQKGVTLPADPAKNLAVAENEAGQPPTTNYSKRQMATFPATSTGRRLALAKWIANRDNPLSARVAVNHIWLRHFGQALVPTVFDFGNNGRPASHPALLDWLAAEFMSGGEERGSPGLKTGRRAAYPTDAPWSMRHIHRLIVTSATYRQDSTPDAGNLALDRDNKYLWRFAPRRAEAEVVRDSLFFVAGKLDMTMGGPDIDFPLALTVPRRTVYFRHAAEKESVWMQIFDGPSVNECYERKHSILPQQALALFNSETAVKNARVLARKIAAQAKDDAAFVPAAFTYVLTRSPTTREIEECTVFLQEQARRFKEGSVQGPTGNNPDGALPSADPALRARENLVHVLMNHHEFVTIR